ncbi:hypothetical protein KY332_05180 [Candidatus Woesearchaeota archaeon]|nr:hypothetical protein [Candidatus Woesearchaeota archaeon]
MKIITCAQCDKEIEKRDSFNIDYRNIQPESVFVDKLCLKCYMQEVIQNVQPIRC